jgi:DNA-binding MarR family transcriptional regulator
VQVPTPQALYEAPSGSDAALVRDLGLLVRQVLRLSNPSVFAAFDELELPFSQTKIVMSFAGREEPRPVNAIAEELGLSLPAASRAVDGLVGRGLVSRTEDTADRRVKQIALTAEGRAITQRLFELRVAGIQEFVASLDEDERRRLASVLEPVVERTTDA